MAARARSVFLEARTYARRPVARARTRAILGGLAVTAALAGCATPGYNASRIQSELERAGATSEQARCVTDGLSNKYDEKQLGSHSEPLDKEFEFTRALLKRCKVTLPVTPPT